MFPFGRPASPRYAPLPPDQAAPCAALHGGAFAHGWSEMEFERLLASEACEAEGAFDGATLSGFILSRVAADEAEVLTLVVSPKARRRGIARQLVRNQMARLATAGVGALFLEVGEDNAAARALYAACGFGEAGRRKGYYPKAGGARVDALVLRRALG